MDKNEEMQVKMSTVFFTKCDVLSDKLTDLDNQKPLRLWVSVYGVFFCLALFFAGVSTWLWPGLIFNSDSVRYILSALIQSQAAVISIVVTLTLVAVQWTASTYSPRVVEVFKRHPNMWLLLFSYIVSITFSVVLLSSITGDVSYFLQRFSVFFAMYLGIFLFIALFPYILNTMNLLNAEKIIVRLLGYINVSEIRTKKDSFQAFYDIIYGAIRNYDMSTMSKGLVLGCEKFEEIYNELKESDEEITISFWFIDDIKCCGLLLVEKEKFVFEIIYQLNAHGRLAIKHNDMKYLNHVNLALQAIGVAATEKKYPSVVKYVMTNLEELAQMVLEEGGEIRNNSQSIPNFTASISLIGQTAVRSDMDYSVHFAIYKISKFWGEYEKKRGQSPHIQVSNGLFSIAVSAMKSHSYWADDYVDSVLSSIDGMSVFFFEIGNEDAAEDILNALYRFAHFAREKGEKKTVNKSSNCIFNIREYAPPGKVKDLVDKYLKELDFQYPEA